MTTEIKLMSCMFVLVVTSVNYESVVHLTVKVTIITNISW